MQSEPAAEWNTHRGGPCPVSAQTKVEVRYRNGSVSDELEAGKRRWEAWPADVGESDWDIVAWRLVGRS